MKWALRYFSLHNSSVGATTRLIQKMYTLGPQKNKYLIHNIGPAREELGLLRWLGI